MTIAYHESDMLDWALGIGDSKTLVHVFASHRRFGGGWRNHSSTQEECLFNRTPLRGEGPPAGSYPIDGAGGRTGFVVDIAGYLAFAFVPAPVADRASAWTLADRARRLAELAAEDGYRHVVSGAWGCGVFKNDPREVARALGEAFRTYSGTLHLCFSNDAMLSIFRAVIDSQTPTRPYGALAPPEFVHSIGLSAVKTVQIRKNRRQR